MHPHDPSAFGPLLEQLLEGNIDDVSRARLIALMEADPALRAEAARQLVLSDALKNLASNEDGEQFVELVTEHAFHLGGEGENEFTERVMQRLPLRRRRPGLLAATALIGLCAVATFLIFRGGDAAHGATIATLRQIDDRGSIVSTEEIAQGYKHQLAGGLLRLDFTNGAVVAIEGPADFEIVSGMVMKLGSGKLNAWCPETAHGFQVLTSKATVTDLGTSFGVNAAADGSANFVVLDGLIEVSDGGGTHRLDEGKAMQSGNSGLHTVAFKADAFHRTWPLASGILSARGAVKAAPPGTAEQLAKMEDNEAVLVIPERRGVPFNHPIEVELSAPGEISLKHAPVRQTLAPRPGTFLRSFLIRYNPIGRPGDKFQRFEGEVTFDRPVLAICAHGAVLEASDPMFATGPWLSADGAIEFRGIDLDQPEQHADLVHLSEDRQTVRIVFNAGLSTDDLRVIVEEEGSR
ncbi:hypothetical protein OKA05_16060 [Luteolibacter arcticus]|uniref:FecR protein domain-containing protein n=1 Tax=Luteolibacter arcticus TaxID=1581411 RepID=A0ABT3GKP4_9BACT|nr:hypothetical protein [Luteolibacter arcticus]MCW1924082.1 hypothetical protein [Luteolibacter arcticus]